MHTLGVLVYHHHILIIEHYADIHVHIFSTQFIKLTKYALSILMLTTCYLHLPSGFSFLLAEIYPSTLLLIRVCHR